MFRGILLLLVSFVAVFSCSKSVQQSGEFNVEVLKRLKSNSKTGIIEMDGETYKKFSLVEHENRNYHLFILFNALDKETNCVVCGHIAKVYQHLSLTFTRKSKGSKIPSFFASIELKDNMEAFQMTEVDRVPVVVHFGPSKRAPTTFEKMNPNDPTSFLSFFASQSGSSISVEEAMKPEPNHNGLIGATLAVALLAGLLYFRIISFSSLIQSPLLWSSMVLGFIVVMLSGYMWVKIRTPPYFGSNNGQDVLYFATSPQAQLGVESRIVAVTTALVALAFTLTPWIVGKFEGANKRRVAALVVTLVYMAGHGALLKFFALKFPGYPFSYIF